MLPWIIAHWGSLFVGFFLCVTTFFALKKLYKDRKNGKGGCGGNCEACASFHTCRKKN